MKKHLLVICIVFSAFAHSADLITTLIALDSVLLKYTNTIRAAVVEPISPQASSREQYITSFINAIETKDEAKKADFIRQMISHATALKALENSTLPLDKYLLRLDKLVSERLEELREIKGKPISEVAPKAKQLKDDVNTIVLIRTPLVSSIQVQRKEQAIKELANLKILIEKDKSLFAQYKQTSNTIKTIQNQIYELKQKQEKFETEIKSIDQEGAKLFKQRDTDLPQKKTSLADRIKRIEDLEKTLMLLDRQIKQNKDALITFVFPDEEVPLLVEFVKKNFTAILLNKEDKPFNEAFNNKEYQKAWSIVSRKQEAISIISPLVVKEKKDLLAQRSLLENDIKKLNKDIETFKGKLADKHLSLDGIMEDLNKKEVLLLEAQNKLKEYESSIPSGGVAEVEDRIKKNQEEVEKLEKQYHVPADKPKPFYQQVPEEYPEEPDDEEWK